MPFEIASGTGKVSSTAKAQLIGMIGITVKPIIAKLNEKRPTFLEGSVQNEKRMKTTVAIEVQLMINLYFWYLSSINPKMNDPTTPKNMNTPPNTELFAEVQPYG